MEGKGRREEGKEGGGRLEEGKEGRRTVGGREGWKREKIGRRGGGRFILSSFQMQRSIKLCLKLTYRFRR